MTNLVIFRGRLKALLSVFIIKFPHRTEMWMGLIPKIWILFHGMLLHSSVAMETCFSQLGSYLENRDS